MMNRFSGGKQQPVMPLIDAPVRKAFFWPCVVGVLIAIG
jgi:hypothetical protein